MATAADLMGLGESPFTAPILSFGPTVVTAFGTSIGSANTVGPRQYFTYVNANTGSTNQGVVLPKVGGDPGCLLGDEFVVANLSGSTITVYAATATSGSAIALQGGGTSVSGTTGVSVAGGFMFIGRPVTISTWIAAVASA